MIQTQIQVVQQVTYHEQTTNQSFIDMHFILKAKGIVNNKFHLVIYDTDLIGVDPRDPNLPPIYKQKVLRECMINYWYRNAPYYGNIVCVLYRIAGKG